MRRAGLTRGVVAGIAAGLIASYAMNQFQNVLTALSSEEGGKKTKPATLKAADGISRAVTGKIVPDEAQTAASNAVHYLTGAVLGAVYGAAAEFFPRVTSGFGVAYGSATWLAIDEGVVPLMGFGPAPDDVPVKAHAFAFASHAVFGVTLELVRRLAGNGRDRRQGDSADHGRR